jgi:hypothetical protein
MSQEIEITREEYERLWGFVPPGDAIGVTMFGHPSNPAIARGTAERSKLRVPGAGNATRLGSIHENSVVLCIPTTSKCDGGPGPVSPKVRRMKT